MSMLSFKKVNFNIPSGLDNLVVNINKMNFHLVCAFITSCRVSEKSLYWCGKAYLLLFYIARVRDKSMIQSTDPGDPESPESESR